MAKLLNVYIIFVIAFLSSCTHTGGPPQSWQQGLEVPALGPTDQVENYTGYSLVFHSDYQVAKWVAYELTKDEVLSKKASRRSRFRQGARTPGSLSPSAYTRSGFDRGHLAPAADMAWSDAAMEDSFLMANVAAQSPELNRGAWKKLESKVRSWALRYERVYVVTGPVLKEGCASSTKKIKCVPSHFYKALLIIDGHSAEGIGFVFDQSPKSRELNSYALSIDEVEALAGLDFFPKLPDELESIAEARFDAEKWFASYQ